MKHLIKRVSKVIGVTALATTFVGTAGLAASQAAGPCPGSDKAVYSDLQTDGSYLVSGPGQSWVNFLTVGDPFDPGFGYAQAIDAQGKSHQGHWITLVKIIHVADTGIAPNVLVIDPPARNFNNVSQTGHADAEPGIDRVVLCVSAA